MRTSRLFIDTPLSNGETILLPVETAHYAANVLRLREGTTLTLFNGNGGEFTATIQKIQKKQIFIQLTAFQAIERESTLNLTLIQALSKADHMDYTIQKAVELGVRRIVPILTERSLTLDQARMEKRELHWRRIIQSACEQCGRNQLPILENIQDLNTYLAQPTQGNCFIFTPTATQFLRTITISQPTVCNVLIGAEGGLSQAEIAAAIAAGYQEISFGKRILRTETAAIAALAACQALWGID